MVIPCTQGLVWVNLISNELQGRNEQQSKLTYADHRVEFGRQAMKTR